MEGEEQKKIAVTATTLTTAQRQRRTDDLPEVRKNDGAGGKYCVGGSGAEESVDKCSKWGGEET